MSKRIPRLPGEGGVAYRERVRQHKAACLSKEKNDASASAASCGVYVVTVLQDGKKVDCSTFFNPDGHTPNRRSYDDKKVPGRTYLVESVTDPEYLARRAREDPGVPYEELIRQCAAERIDEILRASYAPLKEKIRNLGGAFSRLGDMLESAIAVESNRLAELDPSLGDLPPPRE